MKVFFASTFLVLTSLSLLFAAPLGKNNGVEVLYSRRRQKHATYENPILDGSVADPWVIRQGSSYYMTYTQGDRITVFQNNILTDWRNAQQTTVFTAPAGYADVWAPEIHCINGIWYIYFAMDQNGDNASHRMYVLQGGTDPMGSYTLVGKIADPTNDQWAIDGTVLQYTNGNLYFIWSGWTDPSDQTTQNLYIAPMSNPTTISGSRALLHHPSSAWETIGAPINEGPEILFHNGRCFLIYSASGSWTPDYCLGMMGIDGGADPMTVSNWWTLDRCVFQKNSANSVYGTGHASFTVSEDGSQPWIVYHAMQDPNGGWGNRTARTEIFGWNPDGSPAFPAPAALYSPLNVPSGQ